MNAPLGSNPHDPAASHSAFSVPRSALPLVLIGYRGTGKTTVAQQLALALGREWVDADVEVELRAGKSIAAIFADDGEPVFRDLEAQTLAELLRRERIVAAAGGGVVLRESNRRLLAERARVVWLQASVETILNRVAADSSTADRRPNLTTAGGPAEVVKLLDEREPLYRQCAETAIDTENKSPGEIAAEIINRLNLSPQAEPA
jgi:shikimate kinase